MHMTDLHIRGHLDWTKAQLLADGTGQFLFYKWLTEFRG